MQKVLSVPAMRMAQEFRKFWKKRDATISWLLTMAMPKLENLWMNRKSYCINSCIHFRTGSTPVSTTLEMESFWLLHLAQCSKIPIKATAAAILLANRLIAVVVDGHRVDELERKGGLSVLEAITKVSL